MAKFTYTVSVECDTKVQADIVLAERLAYDEEYDDPATGEPFNYRLYIETSQGSSGHAQQAVT